MAVNSAAVRGDQHNKVLGAFILGLALAFVVLFLSALLMQVSTNIAAFKGQSVSDFYINWSLPQQLWFSLFTHQLASENQMPVFGGWFIEILYIGFGFAHEIMIEGLHKKGGLIPFILSCGVYGLIAFDIITDMISGPTFWQPGFFGHLAFTGILIVGVLGLGKLSAMLFARGFQMVFSGH